MDAPSQDLTSLDTDAWLARVAEAGPVAESLAPEADRARRLSADAMAALHEQALFRLLLPVAYGGAEMTLPVFLPVIEAVARHDGSAAWCVAQGNGCASLAGFLDPALAQEIWGRDPAGVLAWGPGKAEARAVEGGYSVTARTGFASGSHHDPTPGSRPIATCSRATVRRGSTPGARKRTVRCSFPPTRSRCPTAGMPWACAAPAATGSLATACSCPGKGPSSAPR